MNKRRLVIVPFVIFLVVAFVGCESAEPTVVPSPTVAPSVNPTNTPAAASTNVPSPTATATTTAPETSRSVTVSDYEAFCTELPLQGNLDQFRLPLSDIITYGEAAAYLSEMTEAWEAVDPPDEAAAWHNDALTAWHSLRAAFDAHPGDSAVDSEAEALVLVSISFWVDAFQAEGLLPRDTRNTMVSAGCLGDDATPDYHGDEQSSATTLTLSDGIEGSLNYLGDTDYFVFTAEAGTSYRIDLPGGFVWARLLSYLLSDQEGDSSIEERGLHRPSRLVLHDSAGTELQSADLSLLAELSRYDFGPIIIWDATVAGDYYISLGDWEIGDYTLIVSAWGNSNKAVDSTSAPPAGPDDHGNDIDSATIVSVGAATAGTINYTNDEDYFRFAAEAGKTYLFDVALGTLEDSALRLSLWDSDGAFLVRTFASESTLAPSASGDYYIEISGWGGQGTYTLTVTELSL